MKNSNYELYNISTNRVIQTGPYNSLFPLLGKGKVIRPECVSVTPPPFIPAIKAKPIIITVEIPKNVRGRQKKPLKVTMRKPKMPKYKLKGRLTLTELARRAGYKDQHTVAKLKNELEPFIEERTQYRVIYSTGALEFIAARKAAIALAKIKKLTRLRKKRWVKTKGRE